MINILDTKHITLHVEIEPSSYCNARCSHCPRDNMPSPAMMSDETFNKIIAIYLEYRVKLDLNEGDDAITWPKFIFSGGGEPILNPRTLSFIEIAKKQGFFTKIYSNAAKIRQDNIERLLDSGIDEISISCHGITQEEFSKSMGHSNFEGTIGAITCLGDKARERGVLMYVTYNALDTLKSSDDDIHAFWKERGIMCKGPFVVWNRAGQLIHYAQRRISLDQLKPVNFTQNVWCLRLKHYDTVNARGDFVHCCCSYFNATAPVLGNVYEDRIAEVHKRYEQILQGKSNSLCSQCIKPNETYLLTELTDFLADSSKLRF